MISENPKDKGWMPKNIEYDHKSEFMIESYLNRFLIYDGYLIRRAEDNYAPDLDVWCFNFENLKRNFILCRIEVEQKINDSFEEYPYPPSHWPYWSFLGRKIDDKKQFKDYDVYILCNKYPHNKIFWITFENIRFLCERWIKIPNNRNEIYYRTKIDDPCFNVKFGYKGLAEYLINLH